MKRAVRITAKGAMRALSKRATSNLKFTPRGSTQRIDPARYLHLAEKGTKAHAVGIRNKRVLAAGGTIYGTRVTIRAKASRFMSLAATTAGPAAVQKAVSKLRELILRHGR